MTFNSMYHRPTPVPFIATEHANRSDQYEMELILQPNGVPVYVTPSHLQTLEYFAAQMGKCSVKEISDQCPPDMVADYDRWLMWKTGCICVWEDFIKGAPNRQQRDTLIVLRNLGLYKGAALTPKYLHAVQEHEDRQRRIFAPVEPFLAADPEWEAPRQWL